MSQKKIKKTDKKSHDLDPNHDQFINKSVSVLDWVYAHRRPLGLLGLVVLLGAVTGIFVDRFVTSRHEESSAALAKGLEASTAPVIAPDPEDEETPVPEKSDLLTFDSSKARATEMLKRWKKVLTEGKSDFKLLGDLGTAASHFELGEYDKAAQFYEKFLSDRSPRLAALRPAAMEGLGYALEAQGKLDDARKKFETLMGESQGDAKRAATYHAGRMAQLKGDKEGAKKLFKQVLDSYSEADKPSRFDVVFVQSRTRLIELDPNAEVPDLPAGGMGAFDNMDPRILRQIMQAQQGAGAS